jgi:hypothetical protein
LSGMASKSTTLLKPTWGRSCCAKPPLGYSYGATSPS